MCSHSVVKSVYSKKIFSGREMETENQQTDGQKLHSRHAIMSNGNGVESITKQNQMQNNKGWA